MFVITDSKVGSIDTVVLVDEAAGSRVTVAPSRGALVTSFFARGREWLFLDEATFTDVTQNVRGGVPVLFPSPGKLEGDRYSRDGASGSMKQHGFARNSVFREVKRGVDDGAWVELELVDTESTRAMFPWSFRFGLRFVLRGASLSLEATVENRGKQTLPFALGYHPYFAVPSAEKAQATIPTRATRAWDNVKKTEIAFKGFELASGEVDLHLIDHASTTAALQTPRGRVELSGDFKRWVIWTLPSRDFVCLEPWTAPGNALNTGDGLTQLAPGKTQRFTVALRVDSV